MTDQTRQQKYVRLSDRIFEALNMALEQKDVGIAEVLARALEMALTRNSGGGEFVERREYAKEVEAALAKLDELRRAQGFVIR